MYPKRFWIITGMCLFVASGVMFVPFSEVYEQFGLSFQHFLAIILAIESVCVMVVISQILKYRPDEEIRESEWRYHP